LHRPYKKVTVMPVSNLGKFRVSSSIERTHEGLHVANGRTGLSWLDNLWLAASLLFALAVLLRLVDLTSLPRWDEMWTLLSARGWLRDGVPRIGEGAYERAELYTILMAWLLKLFGDSLVVVRLSSILFGSLLVVAVFVWTDAVAGRAAAWVTGLFVALDPLSIEMSVYARFYALQALAFWLGAIGVYALATGQVTGTWRWIAVAGGTALSLLCAAYVQITTLMGIVGLGVWIVGVALFSDWTRRHYHSSRFWILLGVLALAGGLAAVAILVSDFGAAIVSRYLSRYLSVPLTVIQHGNEPWFYHLHLIERYPTLWPVLPFVALIAVAARPGPSLWALCVFAAVLVLLSFGGQKSWRYLFVAMPFLFLIWAIALTSLWRLLRDRVAAATATVLQPLSPGLRPLLGWALIAGSFAFLVVANGSTARTVLRPFGFQLEQGFTPDFPRVVDTLEPYVRDAGVVLSSNELLMLYYLDRVEVVVSKERLGDLPDVEFQRDSRTGLPVISRPESLDLIMDCYSDGVLVTDTMKGWRSPNVIDDATSDLIARRMTPIELPDRSRVKAFYWQTTRGGEVPSRCAAIHGKIGPDRAS
jgi:hypothetical protein